MKRNNILLVLLLLCSISLNAQELLTIEQCRDLALKNNKEVAASTQQTRYANYMVKSYRGNFFPDFKAVGLGIYSPLKNTFSIEGGNLPVLAPDATGNYAMNGSIAYFPGIDITYGLGLSYTGGIQFQQPIFMGGKIIAAYKMAKIGQQMAQSNETLTSNQVIVKTDEAYALAVKAKEMGKVAEAYHKTLSEIMKNVESAYRNGMKSKNDVLKVQVKLNESELNLRKAENAWRLAKMNLCHYIGRPLTDEIDVTDKLPGIEDTTQSNDIALRPEYALLSQKVAMAKQQVKLERSEILPQIGVQGNYNYIHGLKLNDVTSMKKASFGAILNVTIPLYHFGERTNKIRAAKAKEEQARLEQNNLNEQMELELMQATNNLDEARLEVNLADKSLEQADENRTVSGNQFKVGMETLSDYLEAQTLWQKAYQTSVEARYALYLKYVEYLKAAGRL